MARSRLLGLAGLVILLVGIGGAAFFLGNSIALGNLSVRRVSPDQAAEAMQNDEFYSDYREVTLLVTGTVVSERTTSGGTVIQLATTTTLKTYCQWSQSPSPLQDGETITVVTEGYNAVRLPSGVSLSDCIILSTSGASG
jgi:hypothetical protein